MSNCYKGPESYNTEKMIKKCKNEYYYILNKEQPTKDEIVKFIQLCFECDSKKRYDFPELKQERMQVISYIYLYLKSKHGRHFLDNDPAFYTDLERIRKELLSQFKNTKENKWFIDILNKNI